MAAEPATIHASAILVGPKAALIRGSAGSGKSQLLWDLLQAAEQGALLFARLVSDDRVHLETQSGQLLVRPAPALAGMIEIRGLGIRRLAYEPVAAVGLVVDLAAADAIRHPNQQAGEIVIEGVRLPRLAAAVGVPPLPLVLGFLKSSSANI